MDTTTQIQTSQLNQHQLLTLCQGFRRMSRLVRLGHMRRISAIFSRHLSKLLHLKLSTCRLGQACSICQTHRGNASTKVINSLRCSVTNPMPFICNTACSIVCSLNQHLPRPLDNLIAGPSLCTSQSMVINEWSLLPWQSITAYRHGFNVS